MLATNRTHTVREMVVLAARTLGMEIEWDGEAEGETGTDRKTGKTVVRINPRFYRPAEVDLLIGDPAKARERLGWEPTTTFEELVVMMAEADDRRSACDGRIAN